MWLIELLVVLFFIWLGARLGSIGIQKDAVKLMESYLPKFRMALGDKKTARFYQLENKIDAVINFGLASNIPLAQ